MNIKLHWTARFSLLFLIAFLVVTFDFLTFSFRLQIWQSPSNFFLVALVNASFLAIAASSSRASGWRLLFFLFLAYFALTGLLVGIETVYLPEQLPMDIALEMIANSAIAALILSLSSVVLFNSLRHQVDYKTNRNLYVLGGIIRLVFSGIIWMFLFVLIGLFVFQPLAKALDEPAAIQYLAEFSGNQEDGIKVLFFQVLRGIIWALMLLPWLRSLRGSRRNVALIVGGVSAAWLGSTFFVPTGISALIQVAHIAEMLTENFIYGICLGLLFYPDIQ